MSQEPDKTLNDLPPLTICKEGLADWVGVHPSTLDRWVKEGYLPPPIRANLSILGWGDSVEVWPDTVIDLILCDRDPL